VIKPDVKEDAIGKFKARVITICDMVSGRIERVIQARRRQENDCIACSIATDDTLRKVSCRWHHGQGKGHLIIDGLTLVLSDASLKK